MSEVLAVQQQTSRNGGPPAVEVADLRKEFSRRDKKAAATEIHTCAVCGATTHFELTAAFKATNPGVDIMGVNMRLFEPGELNGVEVRFPNGKDWPGEGPYEFRRAALTISDATPW